MDLPDIIFLYWSQKLVAIKGMKEINSPPKILKSKDVPDMDFW